MGIKYLLSSLIEKTIWAIICKARVKQKGPDAWEILNKCRLAMAIVLVMIIIHLSFRCSNEHNWSDSCSKYKSIKRQIFANMKTVEAGDRK